MQRFPFIFEMKIFEYTFKVPKLEVVNGKLVERASDEETCTFTLLHKGFGLYEDLTGKPLMAKLLELGEDDPLDVMISKDFISNLACASYVKIEDGKFHNNRATAEEFRKSPCYSKTTQDIKFMRGLIKMALDCIADDTAKDTKTKEKKQ